MKSGEPEMGIFGRLGRIFYSIILVLRKAILSFMAKNCVHNSKLYKEYKKRVQ